ncbi:MAG TPA: NACHT domain-containing protein, partial [Candidatus Kapabacteria bacterium]|nr:NACHT domain-containing protein [Candidatus Kapabacteria bacterium]
MQHEMLEFQKEKEDKGELKEKIEEFKGKLEKGSNRDIYCHHIRQKFKYLDFTGLNAILQKPLLLESIYVKLKAKPSYRLSDYHSIADFNQLGAEGKEKQTEKEKDKNNSEDFVAVFARLVKEYARKQEPMKLVILGQPGSGKTTLMKWIALQCACRKEDVFAHFIPVFIPLKDLGREPEKTYRAKNIRDLTMDMLERETISPSFIKDSFENNQLLFLLDGLDEVAEEDRRREVIDWIQRQNIRKNALLVTSRFSGLQEAKGLKFHDAFPVFAVQDFDIADIERFLENWYQNIEVAVAGDGNKNGAVQKGEKEYEHLMEIIKSGSYENLRKLAVNPLLLTIIAIVHRTRAVLPKERHKLYEECLKVMIELWNVANRKLDVSFTVENSLDNLSNLAVFLMTENRREMELREIEDQLPGEIEGKSLDFFLKEMVLKAGLLYESEGKYGFLHLTFQEYLAAWHFARGKDQNAILAFRDKDYWTETFKLFVNIANAHMFFKEIIANLLEEEYWRQMQLWDDCLADIVVEKSRGDIEIEFAQRILNILPGIEYREENEPLIIQLYVHYPLYKYADQFVKEGWHLFHHALHPFVRSVGSLILNLAGGEAQMQLIGALKARVNEFEKQETKDPGTLMEFLYRNNNSLMLLLYGRRNARDFNFVLAKLKSPAFFIIYLLLRELREDLQYFRELRDLRELRCLRDILDLRELREFRELKDLLDPLEGVQDRLDLRYIKYLRYFRYLRDQYLEKYQAIIEKHKPEIDAWTDQAMAKLHSLTDEELL